jgi:hypothetical protein
MVLTRCYLLLNATVLPASLFYWPLAHVPSAACSLPPARTCRGIMRCLLESEKEHSRGCGARACRRMLLRLALRLHASVCRRVLLRLALRLHASVCRRVLLRSALRMRALPRSCCVLLESVALAVGVGASVSVEGQERLPDDASWMPPSIHLIHRFALNKPSSSSPSPPFLKASGTPFARSLQDA